MFENTYKIRIAITDEMVPKGQFKPPKNYAWYVIGLF